ncbi:crossover junction endodeoxyribonuclease RuvC [Guyparkeria hydrothermalis]|uniref:crossover junction endodeoxyribonuclease RuvC n=1 Tax=Guyparkeria hydrothermalis TaxID=923 RepID=UPI0020226EF9|nr:crossover junction endodeoxyribonuclease RuvC [Guyparkeria hydrothermalis]MCL7744765.1 crossover junction endodeoxyribonuclease RuvC [Guyparkeria hydrothermalis]
MPEHGAAQPVARRVLGIDPGSRVLGLAVIEFARGRARCLGLASQSLQAHGSFAARMGGVFDAVSEWIETHQPHECAIEQIFMYRSESSSLKLAQARGAALAAVVRHGLPVEEYMPATVKQAVVGSGKADKTQVAHMIQRLAGLDELPSADGADAAAVALCHCYRSQAFGGVAAGGGNAEAREILREASQRRYRRRSDSRGWRDMDAAALMARAAAKSGGRK